MSPRQFTVEEANRLIPRLTQLLLDIQDKKRSLDPVQQKLMELAQRMAGNGHVLQRQIDEVQQSAERLTGEIDALVQEVNELGCELKDIDQGLVDFRAARKGREIYLCWKLGEDGIHWWHALDTGYAGRQRLEDDE